MSYLLLPTELLAFLYLTGGMEREAVLVLKTLY